MLVKNFKMNQNNEFFRVKNQEWGKKLKIMLRKMQFYDSRKNSDEKEIWAISSSDCSDQPIRRQKHKNFTLKLNYIFCISASGIYILLGDFSNQHEQKEMVGVTKAIPHLKLALLLWSNGFCSYKQWKFHLK